MIQFTFAILTAIISSSLGYAVVTLFGMEYMALVFLVCLVFGWKMSDWADAFERKIEYRRFLKDFIHKDTL